VCGDSWIDREKRADLSGRGGLVQLGLLVLIATEIGRVMCSIVGFQRRGAAGVESSREFVMLALPLR
jgi:hypothetical protein